VFTLQSTVDSALVNVNSFSQNRSTNMSLHNLIVSFISLRTGTSFTVKSTLLEPGTS